MAVSDDEDRIIAEAAAILERRRAAAQTDAEPEAPARQTGIIDPAQQARYVEHQAAERARLRQEIADMRALAQQDPSAIPGWTPLPENTGRPEIDQERGRLNRAMALGGVGWFTCLECHRSIRGDVRLVGGVTTCAPCWAAHRLGPCDQCGKTDRDGLREHYSDHAWRCASCAADPQPTGAAPPVMAISQ